jgi:hypothetical protein
MDYPFTLYLEADYIARKCIAMYLHSRSECQWAPRWQSAPSERSQWEWYFW